MKKSLLTKVLIALVILILGFVGYNYLNHKTIGEGTVGNKVIYVTVEDKSNNKVLLEKEEFKTDAQTLGEFLKENSDRLDANLQQSQYGTYIVGLLGLESTDQKKGPWWMYGYSSPKGNVDYKVGQAPGSDSINIQDGDSVDFVFTNQM